MCINQRVHLTSVDLTIHSNVHITKAPIYPTRPWVYMTSAHACMITRPKHKVYLRMDTHQTFRNPTFMIKMSMSVVGIWKPAPSTTCAAHHEKHTKGKPADCQLLR